MFESLSDKIQGIFRTLRGHGTLSESQVDAALREFRLALLEADVHFKVTKDFLERIRSRATGEEVLKSLTPAQSVLRIVRDEMVVLLGGDTEPRLETSPKLPSVVLMTGLQGSGKTTTTAKLGLYLQKGGKHPLLVSTDTQRPAAREQLRSLGEKTGLKVYTGAGSSSLELLRGALGDSRSVGHDFLLVDTAGRLHVDDALMEELRSLKALASPTETLYVADAMTGQDAVRSAEEFHRRIGLTGLVLTKLDSDARGGAALSAAAVTGCPIKFSGTGEKPQDFELFQPQRMVSRILGMGDVLSLLEKAEGAIDRASAEAMVEKLRKSEFTLEDYRQQLAQVRKMGPLDQVLQMLPGAASMKGVDTAAGEREMSRAAAIIDSMTPRERREPSLINGSRRRRIAKGSGTSVEDVNRVLKQFLQARKLMKTVAGGRKAMRQWASRLPQFR